MLTFWFFDRFGVGPYYVLSDPVRFSPDVLPPFYCSLLRAWQILGGSGSQNTLVVGSLTNSPLTASSFSCKSCYELLLCLNPCQPHCVTKFLPSFGHLDWPVIWRQLFSFLWTGKLVISAGRFFMVFLPPLSSFLRLVLLFLRSVFVATTTSLSNIFFSLALWLRVVSIGSLLSRISPLAPSLCVRHLLFGFTADELRCVPKVFTDLLNVLKFCIWSQRNDFVFRCVAPSAYGLLACLRARVKFYLPLFSKRFVSASRRRYFRRQLGASALWSHWFLL